MTQRGITRNAVGAVPARRFVALTSTGDGALATGPAVKISGVSGDLDTAAGARLDILLTELAPIETGGAFAPGDFLTAAADGRAVVAAAGNRHGAIALEGSGSAGEICLVLIAPGLVPA